PHGPLMLVLVARQAAQVQLELVDLPDTIGRVVAIEARLDLAQAIGLEEAREAVLHGVVAQCRAGRAVAQVPAQGFDAMGHVSKARKRADRSSSCFSAALSSCWPGVSSKAAQWAARAASQACHAA